MCVRQGGTVNCSLANQLIDDYLEDGLNAHDRRRMEEHLDSCSRCAEELHSRFSLERSIRQAFGISAQHRYLPQATGARIVAEAQNGLRHAIWANRIRQTSQAMVALVAIALVLVGALSLRGRVPLPSGSRPVMLSPDRQLALISQRLADTLPAGDAALQEAQPATPSGADGATLALSGGGVFVEPQPLYPGDVFTFTLAIQNYLPHPLNGARFELQISGPTGTFRFPLSLKGPLRPEGVSLVRITADVLAGPCQEKYLISPAEIFAVPGVYLLRLTLFSPLATQAR
jgi:predicted anti-sigma-YlaC factor YlaD